MKKVNDKKQKTMKKNSSKERAPELTFPNTPPHLPCLR